MGGCRAQVWTGPPACNRLPPSRPLRPLRTTMPVHQQLPTPSTHCCCRHLLAARRKDVARILEQAQRAAQRWEVAYTPFLSPPLAADALAALAQLPDVVGVAWGGYPQAERVRVAMGREDVMLEAQQDASQLADAVAALDCRGAAAAGSSRGWRCRMHVAA